MKKYPFVKVLLPVDQTILYWPYPEVKVLCSNVEIEDIIWLTVEELRELELKEKEKRKEC